MGFLAILGKTPAQVQLCRQIGSCSQQRQKWEKWLISLKMSLLILVLTDHIVPLPGQLQEKEKEKEKARVIIINDKSIHNTSRETQELRPGQGQVRLHQILLIPGMMEVGNVQSR